LRRLLQRSGLRYRLAGSGVRDLISNYGWAGPASKRACDRARGVRYTRYSVRAAQRAAPYRRMRPVRPVHENTFRKKAPASFDAGASS